MVCGVGVVCNVWRRAYRRHPLWGFVSHRIVERDNVRHDALIDENAASENHKPELVGAQVARAVPNTLVKIKERCANDYLKSALCVCSSFCRNTGFLRRRGILLSFLFTYYNDRENAAN